MEPEAPIVLDQQPGRAFQVRGGGVLKSWAGPGEVLEVRRTPRQVLAGSVGPQPLVTIAGADHADPAPEVIDLLTGSLGEEVVGDTDCQFTSLGELHDRAIV